jgi:hypothetical protein
LPKSGSTASGEDAMSWEESTSGEEAQHDPMYRSHLATYHDFVKLAGCSAAATALTLIFLAIILL